MNLLLDTQIVIWSLNEPERLTSAAVEMIVSPANQSWVSAISIWEMVIKTQIGKLRMPENVLEGIARQRFRVLKFEAEHSLAVAKLPRHHQDPFDRALLAQARHEHLFFVTSDRRLRFYDGEAKLKIV